MDWIDVGTAEAEAPTASGVYFFAWERQDGDLLTIYVGGGFSDQGVRKRVLDHIRGRSGRSKCLNAVVSAAADRVWVRWDETDDLDAEAQAFDEFEEEWGPGMRPPCVHRRAHAVPNPGWPEDWLDNWPDDD